MKRMAVFFPLTVTLVACAPLTTGEPTPVPTTPTAEVAAPVARQSIEAQVEATKAVVDAEVVAEATRRAAMGLDTSGLPLPTGTAVDLSASEYLRAAQTHLLWASSIMDETAQLLAGLSVDADHSEIARALVGSPVGMLRTAAEIRVTRGLYPAEEDDLWRAMIVVAAEMERGAVVVSEALATKDPVRLDAIKPWLDAARPVLENARREIDMVLNNGGLLDGRSDVVAVADEIHAVGDVHGAAVFRKVIVEAGLLEELVRGGSREALS